MDLPSGMIYYIDWVYKEKENINNILGIPSRYLSVDIEVRN